MYTFKASFIHSEQDSYLSGCDPDTSITHTFYCRLSSDGVDGLLQLVKDYFGTEDLIFNSCDEPGRLDIQFLARKHDDYAVSNGDIERWKKGEIDLYLKTVTGIVTKTEVYDLKDFI